MQMQPFLSFFRACPLHRLSSVKPTKGQSFNEGKGGRERSEAKEGCDQLIRFRYLHREHTPETPIIQTYRHIFHSSPLFPSPLTGGRSTREITLLNFA